MKLEILQEDPLKVLSSTKPIVENLEYITINENNLGIISDIILKKLNKGLDSGDMHFGETGNFEDDIQLIFLEDVVNFCFWEEKNKPKWKVEYPKENVTTGGWYSLTKCFQRAIFEKIPLLDAEYLINLDLKKAEEIFRGVNGIQIPLLEKRLENLKEAGKVLLGKYKGKFINALEEANFDAIKLVKLLRHDFPSFNDLTNWKGQEIYFLKRAQICAQDFSYFEKQYKKLKIKSVELLTAFADYKIPQMLRKYSVISYKKELGEKIDNYVLIPAGSQEEIEIRSVTIWCIELIRQRLKKFTASEIDNALWLISQDQANVKPYHRTYTIYY